LFLITHFCFILETENDLFISPIPCKDKTVISHIEENNNKIFLSEPSPSLTSPNEKDLLNSKLISCIFIFSYLFLSTHLYIFRRGREASKETKGKYQTVQCQMSEYSINFSDICVGEKKG
jgi:hypothetical protein